MRVYIVRGHTGCYEDRFDWIAHAFTSKERAEDTMAGLDELVRNSDRLSSEAQGKLQEYIAENFDKNCSVDFTGTYYTMEELEVIE